VTRASLSALDPTALHERLAADSHCLGALPSALLLLHREAALHWFILVPATGVADLTDLPGAGRAALLDDAAALAACLKEGYGYPKVNVAALGNVVPQLHLHVVGRKPGDCCWPDPVWGRPLPGRVWTPEALAELRGRLRSRGLLGS
jgi:diadenosine tetraphosphate (Ap4A) HIT family hydrolase